MSTIKDCCGFGKIFVVIPVLPLQSKWIPLKQTGSPTLNEWVFLVTTVAIPDGSSYDTFVIIPTCCCVPSIKILSNTNGVFSKTILPVSYTHLRAHET